MSRAPWPRAMAVIAASCSLSSVMVSRVWGAMQAAVSSMSPRVTASATALACAWAKRNVGWAVNTICATGRAQRAAKLAKSPASAKPLRRVALAWRSTGASVRCRRRARACSPSHSSSATIVSTLVSVRSPLSIWRDNSSASWNTGLNNGVSTVCWCKACKRASRAAISLIVCALPKVPISAIPVLLLLYFGAAGRFWPAANIFTSQRPRARPLQWRRHLAYPWAPSSYRLRIAPHRSPANWAQRPA